MVAAIYKITNNINAKVYVGKTVEVRRRWQQHRDALKSGKSLGKSSVSMCVDAVLHGHTVFEFEILEEFDVSRVAEMDDRELHYILHYQSINPEKGYNRLSNTKNSTAIVAKMTLRDAKTLEKQHHRQIYGIGRNRILQTDLLGNLVAEWQSIKHLSDNFHVSITRQGVQQASKNQSKTYKGFRWQTVPRK